MKTPKFVWVEAQALHLATPAQRATSVTGITHSEAAYTLHKAQRRYEAAVKELKTAEAMLGQVDERYTGPIGRVMMPYD